MSPALLGRALAACLGLGTVDLLALNLLVRSEAPGGARTLAQSPALLGGEREQQAVAMVSLEPARHPSAAPREQGSSQQEPARRAAPPAVVLEFRASEHWLNGDASYALKRAMERLRGARFITVVGHADGSGAAERNERLSAARAASVARRLVEAGIERARLRVDWRGAREPRTSGESKRVEIYLVETR